MFNVNLKISDSNALNIKEHEIVDLNEGQNRFKDREFIRTFRYETNYL